MPVSKARTNKFYIYRQCTYIVYLLALQKVFHSFEFKRQCVYDACNYLLNGTFPFGLSCLLNKSIISIVVFSGDHVKVPHKFIHLIQDFVLCMQCFMHTNPKYVLKSRIFRFIFKEFTNNPALFLLFSTVDTALCDKVCQWLTSGRWFSPDTPVSSTNKTDPHDITEYLLKMALNTITLTL